MICLHLNIGFCMILIPILTAITSISTPPITYDGLGGYG